MLQFAHASDGGRMRVCGIVQEGGGNIKLNYMSIVDDDVGYILLPIRGCLAKIRFKSTKVIMASTSKSSSASEFSLA